MLLALRSVRMTTDLPSDCMPAALLKKYIVAGQNKRDDCFLLFHDDTTRQSPSRSMRRSRWTHRASAAAPRPKGAANEPTWWRKETHEAKIKLRTRTVTASTSTSSLVHQQKLADVFTFLELEVEERLDDQTTVSSKWPFNLEPGPSALETVAWWPKRIGPGDI